MPRDANDDAPQDGPTLDIEKLQAILERGSGDVPRMPSRDITRFRPDGAAELAIAQCAKLLAAEFTGDQDTGDVAGEAAPIQHLVDVGHDVGSVLFGVEGEGLRYSADEGECFANAGEILENLDGIDAGDVLALAGADARVFLHDYASHYVDEGGLESFEDRDRQMAMATQALHLGLNIAIVEYALFD